MASLIYDGMKECVQDFYDLYGQDRYISKKEFDAYLDHYRDIFVMFSKYQDVDEGLYQKMKVLSQNGYKMIDRHNEDYVQRMLEEYKDYFDQMFLEIDPHIVLDEEQRKAIIIDEDYSLVIAGAGSGKTTTMAAKVKFLVEKKKVSPKEIVLLAFTKKAASELNERINEDFKLGVEVMTFHKLGLDFIRKIQNKKVEVIGESGQYQMFAGYVRDIIFPNKKLLRTFIEAFSNELFFDERCYEYDNFLDYWKYYTNMKYEQCKDNIEAEIEKRIQRRIKYFKTINGEYVKSEGEVRIANYLYRNGISYRYEEPYFAKINRRKVYYPDFTLYDVGEPVYIEYYGLATLYRNGNITAMTPEYLKEVYQKRDLHHNHHTDLIELYGQYDGYSNYLVSLSKALEERSIVGIPRTDEEIFKRLMATSQDSLFQQFLRLVIKFINLFKEQNYQKKDFDLLIESTLDLQVRKQLQIIRAFYLQYESDLRKNNRIDFADMINFAYHNMEQLKEKYRFLKYQYVIIDEYQDISIQRYHFAKRLSDLFDAKIVAVGDDWQAIFSFSGSDVELFTRFYESMGYAEIVKITKTYRNSQELIDVAGDFVSQNTEQFQKRLVSDKRLYKPVVLIKYENHPESDTNDLAERLSELLWDIYEENESDHVLLLGRYRNDIDSVLDSKYFKKGFSDKIILRTCPDMKIDFLTVHSSKGLGYDQVILLNAIDDRYGFPSKIEDHALIELIRNKEQGNVDYPEERRLFYVALTRTKNKIYIMCPNAFEQVSSFVQEIIGHPNVLY